MSALFIFPPTPVDTTGLATDSEQQSQTVLLQEIADSTDSIDTKSTDIVTNTGSLLAKTEAALVDEPHDYRELTYVGATTKIDTVVYKLGGAAGATVATLTMAYDGSDRLTSVTKS